MTNQQLPPAVVEVLQRVRRADYDEYPTHLAGLAEKILAQFGIPIKTPEEEMAAEVTACRREIQSLKREKDDLQGELARVQETNQERGRQINLYTAKLRERAARIATLELELAQAGKPVAKRVAKRPGKAVST